MTYQADRTYWRACSTRTLYEAALQSSDELTIALGERLEEYEGQADDIYELQRENERLEREIEAVCEELQELRDAMDLH